MVSSGLIKQGTQRKRYKRNMLLKLPSANPNPKRLSTTCVTSTKACILSVSQQNMGIGWHTFGLDKARRATEKAAVQQAKSEGVKNFVSSISGTKFDDDGGANDGGGNANGEPETQQVGLFVFIVVILVLYNL
jgi:hypothetical protein